MCGCVAPKEERDESGVVQVGVDPLAAVGGPVRPHAGRPHLLDQEADGSARDVVSLTRLDVAERVQDAGRDEDGVIGHAGARVLSLAPHPNSELAAGILPSP